MPARGLNSHGSGLDVDLGTGACRRRRGRLGDLLDILQPGRNGAQDRQLRVPGDLQPDEVEFLLDASCFHEGSFVLLRF